MSGTKSIFMDARIYGSHQAIDYLAERNWVVSKMSVNFRYKFVWIVFWWSNSKIGRLFYEWFENKEF